MILPEQFQTITKETLMRVLADNVNRGHVKISELISIVNQNLVKIGELNDLETTDKSSLVAAINELISIYTTPSEFGEILGDLSLLSTVNKEDLVSALNEVRGDLGDISSLTTENRESIVDALNEILSTFTSVGNVNLLETTNRDSIVDAINEIASKIGSEDLETESQIINEAINEIFTFVNENLFDGEWSSIENRPSTLEGYGVTDQALARSQLGIGSIAIQNDTELFVENLVVSLTAEIQNLVVLQTLSLNNLNAQGTLSGAIIATEAMARAGLINTRIMTPLRTLQAIQELAPNPVDLTKAQVENRTSDLFGLISGRRLSESFATNSAAIEPGSIGSRIFASVENLTSDILPGALISGSTLRYASIVGNTDFTGSPTGPLNGIAVGTALTGTWKCMGYARRTNDLASVNQTVTEWQRVL